jgi:hypothetical protein
MTLFTKKFKNCNERTEEFFLLLLHLLLQTAAASASQYDLIRYHQLLQLLLHLPRSIA